MKSRLYEIELKIRGEIIVWHLSGTLSGYGVSPAGTPPFRCRRAPSQAQSQDGPGKAAKQADVAIEKVIADPAVKFLRSTIEERPAVTPPALEAAILGPFEIGAKPFPTSLLSRRSRRAPPTRTKSARSAFRPTAF
ncbi:hypothetical protein [Sphingomonas sp. 1P08PE]|uniref:hypothetical protein n=1 Tax=Sphingomonas sp. 1P08PE TaxID=554122 RepID=UPI0039A2A927